MEGPASAQRRKSASGYAEVLESGAPGYSPFLFAALTTITGILH